MKVNIESVAIGDCIVDLVEQDGEVLWYAGGAALNLAVGLARLGNNSSLEQFLTSLPQFSDKNYDANKRQKPFVELNETKTALVTQIGLDAHGMRLERYLREEQVRVLPCPNVDYTGVATSRRVNGEPVYHFNASMQRRRIIPNKTITTALESAKAVAISSFAFDVREQVLSFDKVLRARKGKLFLDPNPRPSLVRDMSAFKQGFEYLAPFADFIKLSDDDIKIFYGFKADYTHVAAHLAALGVKYCLITQGAAGASLYAHGQEMMHVDIWHDPRPIVDTMGAGDATFAAFIHFIMARDVPEDTAGWRECLNFAMKSAAATCRAFGGGLQIYSEHM